MAKLKVQRLSTTAGENAGVEFERPGLQFLVTNTTGDNIYVCMDKEYNKDNAVLVPNETSRVVTAYAGSNNNIYTDILTIAAIATSDEGVEVQCILW